MTIRMLQAVTQQHIGQDVPLHVGMVYDVSPGTGRQFIDRGLAVLVSHETREVSVADGPRETKRTGRKR